MTEFAVAVVGAGNIARVHAAAARESGGRVRIAAVVDTSEAARGGLAAETGAEPFATLADCLNSASAPVHGVLVCTPPNLRIPIVQQALERGLPLLIEKPLAHTLADARRLSELAARHPNVLAAVAYCHRFTPAIAAMKQLIERGRIGSISRFENTFAAPQERMKGHWMSDPSVSGGGSLIDTGSHGLDLFLHLIGEAEVVGAALHRAWPGRGESSATVLLCQASERAPGGATSGEPRAAGVIQSGWLEPARFTVTVVGTQGSLHYDYDRPVELLHRSNGGTIERIAVEDHGLRFARQLQAFADAADKLARPPVASVREGLIVAALVDAAYNAAQNDK